MEYMTLQGVDVPALGFGTWRLSGKPCYDMVLVALETGYRHIDTAQLYFNEEAVGRAIRDSGVPRDEIFLTTKLGFNHLGRDDVISSTEISLKKLGTDAIDLLLIHWPSQTVPLSETLHAMEQLVEQGKVRHIGVSNFNSTLLVEACGIATSPILLNQVEYHPYLSQEKLLATCRANGVGLTAYAPIARGRVLADDLLIEIGSHYGKSPVQVTLRWLIQQNSVSAIPKSAHPERVRSNFDIFDFQLTDGEMQSIFGLARGERYLNPDSAPDWDE